MKVLRDSPEVRQRYEELLSSDPSVTVYHTLEWLDLFCALGWDVVFVEAASDTLVPFLVRGAGPFRRAFSMGYDTYGGAVGGTGLISGHAVLGAIDAPTTRIVDFAGRIEDSNCTVEHLKTHIVSLTDGYDHVLENYSRSQRKALRQAADRGVVVRVVDSADGVKKFHALHSRLVEGHGLRPIPMSFLRAVYETMVPAGMARFYEADVDGIVAGGLVLSFNGNAQAWITGYDEDALQARPINAIFDQALRDEIAMGGRSFNLGTSPSGGRGILRFKESFGARETPYKVLWKKGLLFSAASYLSRRRRTTRG